jgi:hypothetical protein
LIESTKDDSVKYDACRILASCYKENGQTDLIKPTLELIPEIYFSKLELVANLLEGDESYEAAQKHKNICADDLISMLIVAGKRLSEKGENDKARLQFEIANDIIEAFSKDFLEDAFFDSTVYESLESKRNELNDLMNL